MREWMLYLPDTNFFKISENIAHSDTPSCIKTKRGVMRTTHNSTYGWSRKILIHLSIVFDMKVDLTFHQVKAHASLFVHWEGRRDL